MTRAAMLASLRSRLTSATLPLAAAPLALVLGACGDEEHDHDHDHDDASADAVDHDGHSHGGEDAGEDDVEGSGADAHDHDSHSHGGEDMGGHDAEGSGVDAHDHDSHSHGGEDMGGEDVEGSGADAHDHDGHSEEDGLEHDEAPSDKRVSLQFALTHGTTPVGCGAELVVGSDDATVTLSDARVYVYDVALVDADGATVPVVLDENDWQRDGVGLLDFEDGTEACTNGNAPTHTALDGTVPAGDYVGLTFRVGVPAALNHADAATADPPLNFTALFWSWQSGYKFIRIEALNGGPGLRLHLGSTGCTDVEGETVCARGNRPLVTLDAFDADADTVLLDLQATWSTSPAGSNTEGTAPGCMSAPDDPECVGVFEALALGTDGEPMAGQRVFRVAPR